MKFTQTLSLLILSSFLSLNGHAFTVVAKAVTAGWNTKSLTFNVNETSCTGLGISATALNTAIDAAIELWNSAPTSNLKLVRGSVVTTNSNSNPPTIYCSNTSQTDGVAGVGSVGQTTSGHPSTGSLALNADSSKQAYFGNLNATYQAIITAHEIGHVLGLGHSEKQYALMYYDISSKQNLSLSQDDVDGITWLNPRSDFSDGIMGCGTIKDIGGKLPPSNGMGAVALNWLMLLLLAYGATKVAKLKKKLTVAATSTTLILEADVRR